MTFLEGEDRNFSDVRLYIQEYPQYASPSQLGSWIDLNDAFYNDAFYNDAPYTGVWEDEIAVPLDLIDVGEEFHVCIEDTRKDITLACYELENGSESEPERLKIDFNNFPNSRGGSSDFDISDRTDGCFDEGYEDGRDNPFDIDKYDKCGGSSGGPGNNAYYNRFVAGCLSVKGKYCRDM